MSRRSASGGGPAIRNPQWKDCPPIKRSVDREGRFAHCDLKLFFVNCIPQRIILGRCVLIMVCSMKLLRKFLREKSQERALFFGKSPHPDNVGASSGREGLPAHPGTGWGGRANGPRRPGGPSTDNVYYADTVLTQRLESARTLELLAVSCDRLLPTQRSPAPGRR